MKILLVNPPDIHSVKLAASNQLNFLLHINSPPMGLLYLKSYLKQKTDFPVLLWNGQVPSHPGERELKAAVEQFAPDLVGITVNTFNWYDSLECAKSVKAVRPDTHLVLGGPHLTLYPEESLTHPQIDSIVMGEGEDTLLELASQLAGRQGLKDIAGLWFKQDGRIFRNRPRPVDKNLDRLSFPDRSDLSLTQHRVAADPLTPAAVIVVSRGCPFQCSFCGAIDRVYRRRSAQNVVQEMRACREMGYKAIDFYDDLFNLTKNAVMELCDEIIRQKVGLPWSCRGRVDPLDEEMVAKMAEAGCQRMHLGVESATQEILDQIKKGTTPEQCRRAFALAKKYHISTLGFFMIGFPGETRKQAMDTIRFAFELNPDFALFLCLMPTPGSEIYEQAIHSPTFYGDYFREFVRNPTPDFVIRSWTTTLQENEQYRLIRYANLRFYFRPQYLLRSFQRLQSFEDFSAKAKMAFKILTV